jgi:hypothetical protein
MIDYDLNLKAFLKKLPLATMSGHEKFLAVGAVLCKGVPKVEVAVATIRSHWRKSVLKVSYNAAFYTRAETQGWVNPSAPGKCHVSAKGLEHLEALAPTISSSDIKQSGQLIIFNRKAAQSFDKFLRAEFAGAKSQVLIADTYVSDVIFDIVLDVIPTTTTVKLIYGRSLGSFDTRSFRFAKQFTKYQVRKHNHFHERFVIIDDKAFVIGPSIKDATDNAPALVVALGSKEKSLLVLFFNELWAKAK